MINNRIKGLLLMLPLLILIGILLISDRLLIFRLALIYLVVMIPTIAIILAVIGFVKIIEKKQKPENKILEEEDIRILKAG